MTQSNKFEDLNGRFASLGTGMTQRYKFRDRWWTLLNYLFSLDEAVQFGFGFLHLPNNLENSLITKTES